jgi:hypothetical protein
MTTFPKGAVLILTAFRPGIGAGGFVSFVTVRPTDARDAALNFIARREDISRVFPELILPGAAIGFVLHIIPGDGTVYCSTAHLKVERAILREAFDAALPGIIPIVVDEAFANYPTAPVGTPPPPAAPTPAEVN